MTSGTWSSAEDQRRSLSALVAAAIERYGGKSEGPQPQAPARVEPVQVDLLQVDVLRRERPGLVGVLAAAGGSVFHVVLGLRSPGDEAHFLPEAEEPILGLYEDEDGLAVAIDALFDADLAIALLQAVLPEQASGLAHVRLLAADDSMVRLAFDDRLTFSFFRRVAPGTNPVVDMLVKLDEAGFNHIPAPLGVWRGPSGDLGIVQEQLFGASPGTAVAESSLRDLYESRCDPAEAGGDFAPEAHALGTMTARMHLALDRAFGRRPGEPKAWADEVEKLVSAADPALLDRPDVAGALVDLRGLEARCASIRAHGDMHLARVCRTEQGWYLWDLAPQGGEPYGRFVSPLLDVATMLWSFGQLAGATAAERDIAGDEDLVELERAWERRSRRAFLAGYLNVPGIHGLVPHDKYTLRTVTAALELGRAARERLEVSPADELAGA